jgi:hypothetical protein
MATELAAQANIKASVIRDGGYSVKLSHRFVIGVPDLLVALPPFAPCLVEVKDLGDVVDRFDKQVAVTPKQSDVMRRMSEPYEGHLGRGMSARYTSCVFVAFKHRGVHRLVALRRDATRLTYMYEELHPWTIRQKGLHYMVGQLLAGVGIARMAPP